MLPAKNWWIICESEDAGVKITLKNDQIIAQLSTLGGAIESLRDLKTGEEHVWPYDASVWPRRTSICFPICSVLKNGSYIHDGQTYALPMHGFLREMDMQVVSQQQDRLVLRCESNDWTREMYPFDFAFELVQYLEDRSLIVEYRISNTGSEALPFSTGCHYTYRLPVAQNACSYLFSAAQHAGSLEIEDGEVVRKSADIFQGASTLSMNGLFDTGSKIFETEDLSTDFIAIAVDGKPFTTVAYEGFPYVVLWAPKGGNSPFACIEAWAGIADCAGHDGLLLHKKGIQIIAPNETRTFRQRISIC